MTDEQINAAIETALRRNEHWIISRDYCKDLNAMHEAETWLRGTDDERLNSMDANKRWALYTHDLGYWSGIAATARQRAEAFLRTLGKWEEAE